MLFFINTLISALTIAAVAEIGKRSTLLASLLISIPLTSILALSFQFVRTGETTKVIEMCYGVIWLVIPTFGFFLLFPWLLKTGVNFWLSLFISCVALAIGYSGYSWLLRRSGILI